MRRFGVRTAAPGAAFGPERAAGSRGLREPWAPASTQPARPRRCSSATSGTRSRPAARRRSRSARAGRAPRTLAVAPGGAAVAAWLERDERSLARRRGDARGAARFGPAERVSGAVPGTRRSSPPSGARRRALAWSGVLASTASPASAPCAARAAASALRSRSRVGPRAACRPRARTGRSCSRSRARGRTTSAWSTAGRPARRRSGPLRAARRDGRAGRARARALPAPAAGDLAKGGNACGGPRDCLRGRCPAPSRSTSPPTAVHS